VLALDLGLPSLQSCEKSMFVVEATEFYARFVMGPELRQTITFVWFLCESGGGVD
jgi:hypothetical protein